MKVSPHDSTLLRLSAAVTLTAGLALAACGDGDEPMPTPPAYPMTLSEFGFFEGDMRELIPVDGVIPYDVISTLWADGSGKGRFFVLPEGEQVAFDAQEEWVWPDGSIVIKNFILPLDLRDPDGDYRIVETRLLVRENGDWSSLTYVWNEEETEATRLSIGTTIPYSIIGEDGDVRDELYTVPSVPQCRQCHGRDGASHLLGLVTAQVNMDVDVDGQTVNQISFFESLGVFSNSVPDTTTLDALVNPLDEEADLEDRARAYLHANCAHCHREGAAAYRSGLVLTYWNEDDYRYGFCKTPVAAGSGTGGRLYAIQPGASDESIVTFRMDSVIPGIKMPELTNRIVDNYGVHLVAAWIDSLEYTECNPIDDGSGEEPDPIGEEP